MPLWSIIKYYYFVFLFVPDTEPCYQVDRLGRSFPVDGYNELGVV